MDTQTATRTATQTVTPESRSRSGEITITRRLFRSGESEYLIDGTPGPPARHPGPFHGHGPWPGELRHHRAGPHRPDSLSNKPQDRRAVIEEAAGITKFKTAQRLAEAKLESAKQNLARVFDILEEVTRQVNSLKRQAAKAQALRGTERRAGGAAAHRARRPLPDAGARSRQNRARSEPGAQRSLRISRIRWPSKRTEHARLQETCYRTEAELTEARQQLAELKLEAERTRGRWNPRREQIGDHRAAHDAGRAGNAGARSAGIAQHQQELEAHLPVAGRARSANEAARERLAAKTASARRIQQDLQERARTHRNRPPVSAAPARRSLHAQEPARPDRRISGRDRARYGALPATKKKPRVGDLERLERVKAELSRPDRARQLELESMADRSARGRGTGGASAARR